MARTSARQRELAIRAALGAGHGRLIQQFLVESFALSLAARMLGILIAAGGLRILPVILPQTYHVRRESPSTPRFSYSLWPQR
ncbi:FtsX-like permease family protein [Edaphobacter modestus]|uniref:FtsX-like permease family protein n=1 Tax=Edaphobacter modestus TaxID=388466 RepID=UPI003BF896BE